MAEVAREGVAAGLTLVESQGPMRREMGMVPRGGRDGDEEASTGRRGAAAGLWGTEWSPRDLNRGKEDLKISVWGDLSGKDTPGH